ncbi:hypothetical protein GCM10020229_53240 [Kitasatospora albolonga]
MTGTGTAAPNTRRASEASTRRTPGSRPPTATSPAHSTRVIPQSTASGADFQASPGTNANINGSTLNPAVKAASRAPVYVEPRSSGPIPLIMDASIPRPSVDDLPRSGERPEPGRNGNRLILGSEAL